MFKKIVSLVLIYFQVIVPEYYMYEAISQLVQPASAYADVANPVQNPVCDKRCYDARTDNPRDSYWHYYNSSTKIVNFNVSKGINMSFWVKVKSDGYYVQGDKLNVYQSGDTATLSFVHPDGKTYSMTLKSKKNTWVVFVFSINPNFIAGVSRNGDTGEFDTQIFEFPYNPIDFDDPTKDYNIVFTEGVLADGMYWINMLEPFPSGVRPFCSEQIAFCHHEWSDSTSRAYKSDPNRINFSVAWWAKEDVQGNATCTWYDEDSKTYICDINRGSLFRNTATELRDGAEGIWSSGTNQAGGSWGSSWQTPVQIPNWCDIFGQNRNNVTWCSNQYSPPFYTQAPFISHTSSLNVPGGLTYTYRFKFKPRSDCKYGSYHYYRFTFVVDAWGTFKFDGATRWQSTQGSQDMTGTVSIQIPYNPGLEHTIEFVVSNESSDPNVPPGYNYNAMGMALTASCRTTSGWVEHFDTGTPGWQVMAPLNMYLDSIGVIQSKTENSIKETYGHELNKETVQWEKKGFRRVAPVDPPPGGYVGKLTISAPPALQPVNVTSDRQPGWVTYQFSDNWFWSDTGVLPKQCPTTGPQVGGTVKETIEACWEQVASLCKPGNVNLYPTYNDCYLFVEAAACWDGQTKFGNQCYLYSGTPSICPSDGYSYTLITPPAANYICRATASPSCPAGTVRQGGDCYEYINPGSCPAGSTLDTSTGQCYYSVAPSCPAGQIIYSGNCMQPQLSSDPCPVDYDPNGNPITYMSAQSSNGYVCLRSTRTTSNFSSIVTITCRAPKYYSGEAEYKGLCYYNPYTDPSYGRIDYFAYGYIMHDPSGYFVCDNPAVQYTFDCGCAAVMYTNNGYAGTSDWLYRLSTSCLTCSAGYTLYTYPPLYPSSPCVKVVGSACPAGYTWDAGTGRCIQYAGSVCPAGYTWDAGSQKCKRYVSSACDYGTYWSYNSNTDMCERNIPAECPAGQEKFTNPSTGYYACYTLDLSHGTPPGHVYCRNNLTFYNDRCYRYVEPVCNNKQYSLVLGSANAYGEWTGTCWNNFDSPCPSGTFKARGEHTTQIHCLRPEMEASIKIPATPDELSNLFCNALLLYKAGAENYKPCINVPQIGNWTGCPDSVYVGEGKGPWKCPLNPQYSCIRITDYMEMCGTDKNCAACYPGNIEGNVYNYVEIQEIKDIPGTNPKKVTGKYANQYNYPNAKQRVAQVNGRLPYPSEVNVIQSLWGTTNFWVDDQPPVACNIDPNSSGCLDDLRDVIVVWDDATKAGFYASCVYTSTGDAVCTGDAVDCVNGVCPINSALPCADWNGKKICSATKCKSVADPAAGETEIVNIDDTMYQDDGQRDDQGNCLGQIYIFTGKASRCRPPGVTVGLLNDCCESGDKVVSDSTGSAMDLYGAISTIKDMYHIGKAAYYAYQIANGTYSVYMVDGVVVAGMTPNITMTSSMVLMDTATGQLVDITGKGMAIATYQGGMAGVEGAASTAITNYVQNVLLNPTTLAIQAAIYVVTKLLFGNGCDNNDVTTVMLRDSKYCHFVGNYCEKKWPIIGCVQKAKGYCCFNSKLGRIIHEQGRPQLIAFQPDGNWGEGKRPYCRGFTPEEFQMLDFSKIDLSEYFEDIQKDMDKKLQQMQETATQKVNEFYNRMSQ